MKSIALAGPKFGSSPTASRSALSASLTPMSGSVSPSYPRTASTLPPGELDPSEMSYWPAPPAALPRIGAPPAEKLTTASSSAASPRSVRLTSIVIRSSPSASAPADPAVSGAGAVSSESFSDETAPAPETAGSAGALAEGEERITIDVSLTDRGDAALDDAVVNFSAGGAPILGKAAGGAGQYDISLGSNSPGGKVDAVRGYEGDSDPDIGVSDALNALRLAVGLPLSFETTAMDFIAADVDQSGEVGVSGALDILRFAVGLETENAPRWVFMDEGQDLSGVDADNVVFDTGAETGAPDQLDGPVELTGVLLGSVSEVLGSPAEA